MSYAMRKPCVDCGSLDGTLERKGLQDVVRCARCDRYAYCAPRSETGLPAEPPKPLRLVSKYSGACNGCGVRYRVGDWVWWTRGTSGARCLRCGDAS